jgi:hypothetical protein
MLPDSPGMPMGAVFDEAVPEAVEELAALSRVPIDLICPDMPIDGLEVSGLLISAADIKSQRLKELQLQKQLAVARDDYEEARKLKTEISALQDMLLKGESLGVINHASSVLDLSPSQWNTGGSSPSPRARLARVGSEVIMGSMLNQGSRLGPLDTPTSRTGLFAATPLHDFYATTGFFGMPPSPAPSLSVGHQMPASNAQRILQPARDPLSPRVLAATMREMPTTWRDSSMYSRQLPRAGALTCVRSSPDLTLSVTPCQLTGSNWDSSPKKTKHNKRDRSEAANVAMTAMKGKDLMAAAALKEHEL